MKILVEQSECNLLKFDRPNNTGTDYLPLCICCKLATHLYDRKGKLDLDEIQCIKVSNCFVFVLRNYSISCCNYKISL